MDCDPTLSEKERLAVGSPAPAVNATGTGTSGVFVRDATGLVKNVSFLDSIALNLSNMSIGALLGVIGLSGMLPMLFWYSGGTTGVNLVYLCLIAFVIAVPQIVIYTVLTRRYPRAGGDYVFVSRNLGGFVGSVASFVGYTTETTAYLALIALSTVFAIGTVGLFFNISSNFYLGISAPVGPFFPPATPSWQFVIGMLIFAVLIGINIVKPKAGYRLVSVLTIVGIAALLVAIGTYLAAGPTGVQNYVNGISGNGYFTNSSAPSSTYYNVVNGIHTGGPPGSNSFAWGPTIFLLPLIAAFVFPWLNAAPAVAGEIKGKSAVRWNVPISAALAFIFLISSIGVMYWAAGQAFTNAAFSNTSYVFGSPSIFAFNFWTFAMGLSGNSFVAAFIGLGWIFANLGILAYGIIVISRYLLAQSFDRFLPSTISDVNPRFGSPAKAFIISLVVTIFLVGYAAYNYTTENIGAGTNPLFGAILASMIYFMVVGAAAIVHGIRKETGILKVVMPLAGIGNILAFGFISYEFLSNQAMWSINSFTEYWLVGCLLLGIVLFVGSYYYHKGRGVNINLAYKEIPPE